MLIKYTFDSKSQTLRMRYPFQSIGRPTSHRNGWSFRVDMIPLRDFVPEWNSRPGTRTGVNSRRGNSRRHDILWWYHLNKYRAKRGNRSELASVRKSPAVSCKHPLIIWFKSIQAKQVDLMSHRATSLKLASVFLKNLWEVDLKKFTCYLPINASKSRLLWRKRPRKSTPVRVILHKKIQTYPQFPWGT